MSRGLRDVVLFVAGLAGIAHETLAYTGATRTELLLLFSGMIGLPIFFRADEARSREDPEP